jgi:BTB And C-terminal Kelch
MSRSKICFAYAHASGSARDTLYRSLLRQFTSVIQTRSFAEHVDLLTLSALLSSVALQAKPCVRIDAALLWVKHDQRRRNTYLPDLLLSVPAGLLTDKELSKILAFEPVQSSYRARNAVCDMRRAAARPYFNEVVRSVSHSCGSCKMPGCTQCCPVSGQSSVKSRDVAVDITDLRVDGGNRSFAWTIHEGNVEFVTDVVVSPCMRGLNFTLRCVRVQVADSFSLPSDVTAHLKVKLCYSTSIKNHSQHGHCPHSRHIHCHYHHDHIKERMQVVGEARVEEKSATLVKRGKIVDVHKHMESMYCDREITRLVNGKCNFSLFVQVMGMWVNDKKYE